MKDYVLHKALKKECELGNVVASESDRLTIYKYSQDCQFENRWNEINRLARGIIFDDDSSIVARPLSKFFNLGERPETMPENIPWHEPLEIFEKIDGSCGIAYFIDNDWWMATPGSMVSDQAQMGTFLLRNIYSDSLKYIPKDCTPIFEIVYPGNRIVVDYNGFCGLYLLAVVELGGQEWRQTRVDRLAEISNFRRPERYDFDLQGDIPFEENSEGYVCLFDSGLRIKVKSPTYVRIHRLLNYLSPKGVIELLQGREYRVTLQSLPSNIARDFDDIRAQVQLEYSKVVHRCEFVLSMMPQGLPRKEQAFYILANTPKDETGVTFGLLDKKDVSEGIWKLVLNKFKDEKKKEIV